MIDRILQIATLQRQIWSGLKPFQTEQRVFSGGLDIHWTYDYLAVVERMRLDVALDEITIDDAVRIDDDENVPDAAATPLLREMQLPLLRSLCKRDMTAGA